jgi:signal transduction histidine kinase
MTMIPSGLPGSLSRNPDPITAEVLRAAIHDLKGPSGRLRVLAELVNRSQAIDDDTRTLLNHISDSARAMDATIDALRNYSELLARPISRERTDLAIPLSGAISNRAAELKACGAEVAFAGLPFVSGDRLLLTSLFEELLGNAVRFRAAEPPRIRVAALPPAQDGPIISVSDNGRGIQPDLLERVFRPFKKASGDGGAGLGLTICSKIVDLHGGRIWAEARTGGAEIRIQLPA